VTLDESEKMSSSTVLKPDANSPIAVPPLNELILPRIAAGDASAVDDCLSRYGGLVWSLARRWFGNASDAEDVTQEIFVDLWQSAKRYDPQVASEAVFITMIARRRMIDRVRRAKTSLNAVSADVSALDDVAVSDQNRIELADEAAKASRCLERLTNEQRKILTMSIHQGAAHSVISQTLGLPLGTVKSFARRGLIQLRDCMQRSSLAHVSGNPS
jgi:RNA polymerase sigma factor (sigma-70 family)